MTAAVRRWLTVALGVLLAAPLVVLLQAGPAAACSCARLTPQEQVDIADVVVTGTVEDVVKEGADGVGEVVLGVSVDRVYKGDAGDGRLVVRTADSSAACGLGALPPSSRWVFYLDDEAGLRANVCGGSRRATAASVDDLESVAGAGAQAPGDGSGTGGAGTEEEPGAALRLVADSDEPDALRLATPGLVLAGLGLLGLVVVTAYRRRRGAGS